MLWHLYQASRVTSLGLQSHPPVTGVLKGKFLKVLSEVLARVLREIGVLRGVLPRVLREIGGAPGSQKLSGANCYENEMV